MPVAVIINADDFGYAEERDRGILEAAVKGCVSSVSILANGRNAEVAVERWKKLRDEPQTSDKCPGLGLHINFTEGEPIAAAEDVESLVTVTRGISCAGSALQTGARHLKSNVRTSTKNTAKDSNHDSWENRLPTTTTLVSENETKSFKNTNDSAHSVASVPGSATVDCKKTASLRENISGLHENNNISAESSNKHLHPFPVAEFRGKFGFEAAVHKGLINMDDVETELRAQLQWFRDRVGFYPNHVDGHNHAHVLPGVREVIARVCREAGVTWIRMPVEDMEDEADDKKQKSFCQRAVHHSRQAARVFRNAGFSFTDKFYGLQLMGKALTKRSLIDIFHYLASEGQKGQNITVEIMTHPGYRSTSGDLFSKSSDREHELSVLLDASVNAAAKALG